MASSSRGGQISRAEKLDRDLDVVEISDDETHHSAPPPPKRVRHTIRPSAFGSTKRAVASDTIPLRYHAPQHPARTLPSQQRIPSLEEQLDMAIRSQQDKHDTKGEHCMMARAPGGTTRSAGGSRDSSASNNRAVSEGDLKQQLLRTVLTWSHVILGGNTGGAWAEPSSTMCADSSSSDSIEANSSGTSKDASGVLCPPVRFASLAEYQSHFRPLLLMELQEELVKGREERQGHAVNASLIATSMPRQMPSLPYVEPLPGGQAAWELTMQVDDATDVGELDVVILRSRSGDAYAPNPSQWPQQLIPHLPAVGIVVWRERSVSSTNELVAMRVLLALPVRAFTRSTISSSVESPAIVQVLKLGQCTSAWREWLVLHKFMAPLHAESRPTVSMELLKQLLAAAPSSTQTAKPLHGAEQWSWRDKWKRLVKAVCDFGALDQDQRSVLRETSDMVYNSRCGFSLVQGPPGTGKSTLLRALLNVLHNATTQDYFERVLHSVSAKVRDSEKSSDSNAGHGTSCSAVEDDLLSQITQSLERVSNSQRCVRRDSILVCAQSNAAIDEVVARLLRDKFVDEFGQRYDADFVRIGHSPAEAVRVVSLKHRVGILGTVATGAAAPGERPGRTLSEQESQLKKMASTRAVREKEQTMLARERLTSLARQTTLQKKVDLLEARGEDVHSLLQRNRQLDQEEHQLAKRIVELQIEIDQLDATMRSMEIVKGCLRRSSTSTSSAHLGSRETRMLEREILDGAHIVFCTLNGAGEAHRLSAVSGGFETVIFDEAAQAGELSTLIPLQYGAKRVILIGDPQQLPATVISREAKRQGYDVSLFERLHRGGHVPRMLRTQYRMHPAIRAFPSAHFYHGALRDGERVLRAAHVPAGVVDGAPGFLALPGKSETRLAPYAFFDLLDSQQTRGNDTRSLRNDAEAGFCVRLLLALVCASDRYLIDVASARDMRQHLKSYEDADHKEVDSSGGATTSGGSGTLISKMAGSCCAACGSGRSCILGDLCGRVVLLTPYREQKRALEQELTAAFGTGAWEHAVEVASVDAFQGKEKDVVIYSAVRSGRSGLGFVRDLQRMNVALTRARHALYIVGSDKSLRASSDWLALLDDAKARGLSCEMTLATVAAVSAREMLAKIPVCLLDGTREGGANAGVSNSNAAASVFEELVR